MISASGMKETTQPRVAPLLRPTPASTTASDEIDLTS